MNDRYAVIKRIRKTEIRMEENVILVKSKHFALSIIEIYKSLSAKNEHIMSKQLLRSGTSIGANAHEAVRGVSKADFYNKLNIALKEANETDYWLELLGESGYIEQKIYQKIKSECDEIISILVAITKTQQK